MGNTYGESYRRARDLRMAFAGHKCEVCKHDGRAYRVEAHHAGGAVCYERDRRGHMTLHDLVILCARCHDLVTDRDRRERYAASVVIAIATPRAPVYRPDPSPPAPMVVPPTPHRSVPRPRPAS